VTLCGTIPDLPTSVNSLYRTTRKGVRKTAEGVAFENRCKQYVGDLLEPYSMTGIPQDSGWRAHLIQWMPRLETVQWIEKGIGCRFTLRDVDGPLKLALDGIFRAIGVNDSHNVKVYVEKRDGKGSSSLDFLVEEMAVPAEHPNATELACRINQAKTSIRASASDPLVRLEALLGILGEPVYRMTPFDHWRLVVMSTLLKHFDKLSGLITCPAKSGRLDSCFECSDMMVVNCLLGNAQSELANGRIVGLFDLKESYTGSHVCAVDRRDGEGEKMENQQINQRNPRVHLVEALNGVLHVDKDTPNMMRFSANAINRCLHAMKGAPTDPPNEETSVQVCALLMDMIAAGANKAPKESVAYYQSLTSANMTDSLRSGIKNAGGPFRFAVTLYKQYLGMTTQAANTAKEEAEKAEKTRKSAPKKTKKEPKPKPEEAVEPEQTELNLNPKADTESDDLSMEEILGDTEVEVLASKPQQTAEWDTDPDGMLDDIDSEETPRPRKKRNARPVPVETIPSPVQAPHKPKVSTIPEDPEDGDASLIGRHMVDIIDVFSEIQGTKREILESNEKILNALRSIAKAFNQTRELMVNIHKKLS